MRHLFYIFIITIGFLASSCASETTEGATDVLTTLTITTEQTRTHLSDDETHAEWDSDDRLMVFETSATTIAKESSNAIIDNSGKASFTVDFPSNSASTLRYIAVYPSSAIATTTSIDTKSVELTLPSVQHSTSTTYDGNADILVSNIVSRSEQQTSLNMKFKRMVAVAKMSLSRIPFTTIDKVSFTSNDADIAGLVVANLDESNITSYKDTNNTIVVEYQESIDASSPIFFTLLPTELREGGSCTITVFSGEDSYTHQFTIPAGRTLRFEDSAISTFNVDMQYKKQPTEDEEVDLTDIAGTWRLSEWAGSADLNFSVYLSITVQGNVDMWQRIESRSWEYYNSTATSKGGVISGVYSDGAEWGASYNYVVNDANTMTWTNTEDGDDISVYVRAELPEDLETTRANDLRHSRFL